MADKDLSSTRPHAVAWQYPGRDRSEHALSLQHGLSRLLALCLFPILLSPVTGSAQSQTQLPMLVGVLDLEANGVSASEARSITDRLRIYLNRSQVFDVLERRQMEGILREQGFQLSGACDNDQCVIDVGKILGARKMIAGSVSKVGDVYSLQVRIVDVTTGRIEQTAFADTRGDIGTVLQEGTLQAALRLIQAVRVSLGLPPSEDLLSEEAQLRGETGLVRYPNGWHMRWNIGGASYTIGTEGGFDADLVGEAVSNDVEIGVAISDRLSLLIGLTGITSLGLKFDYGDRVVSPAPDTSVYVLGGLLGVTYYLVPRSLYVSVMTGGSRWNLREYKDVPKEDGTGTEKKYTTFAYGDSGFGFQVIIGKEWWISRKIGFGMAGKGMFYSKTSAYALMGTFIWDF
jgi:hypothetical protein